MSANSKAEPQGVIGRVRENGLPVIYKFVNQMPEPASRAPLPWLTVIAWTYDGDDNNGMPGDADNQAMVQLEDVIEEQLDDGRRLRHAYSRTGNNLKELVYYSADRDGFIDAFNGALDGYPRFPIEINFYEDPDWKDLRRLLEDFSDAPVN